MGEDSAGRPSGRRVSVDEAARALGLSVDAIRKRVQRETIPFEKDAAGRVRIILDEPETLQDERQDTTGLRAADAADAVLLEELRDRVRYLERRLDEEREARTEERRRHDTLLAQLMQRIPELEAPQAPPSTPPEPRESSVSSGPSSSTPTEAAEGPQEPAEQRTWWRRLFDV